MLLPILTEGLDVGARLVTCSFHLLESEGAWRMDGTERVFDMELFAFTRVH